MLIKVESSEIEGAFVLGYGFASDTNEEFNTIIKAFNAESISNDKTFDEIYQNLGYVRNKTFSLFVFFVRSITKKKDATNTLIEKQSLSIKNILERDKLYS